MKLAIMQPYFFPYIGYFQLLNYVDTYVLYDDVNYINRGWVNRNYILVNNEKHLLTLSLNKASQNKLINEIEISGSHKSKMIKTIQRSYARAPFFSEAYPLIESAFQLQESNLAIFLYKSILMIADFLGCNTKIVLSSQMNKNNDLKGQTRILHICETLGATHYVNAIGGMELYSKKEFQERGIHLNFLKTDRVEYEQYGNHFEPNLSIIDVLMFSSKETVKNFLMKFQLV